MFESATRGRATVYGKGGEVLVDLIFGDLIREALKAKTDDSDAAKIVVKGALALTLQLNLLKKRFADFVKSLDR